MFQFPGLASLLIPAAGLALVIAGAAIQVAVGAGLSVVCGFFLLLWLGPSKAIPTLLCLNLLVSVVATVFGGGSVRWADALLASCATLIGCFVASVLPAFPAPVLKGLTACVLIVVALPRPALSRRSTSEASARAGLALAGIVTGALTVWTATPGPIIPVAMARAGRTGLDIRRAMQPISVIGYGAALAWNGPPSSEMVGSGLFAGLIAATLVGIGTGFYVRRRLDSTRVVLLIRMVAAIAAGLLILSLFR